MLPIAAPAIAAPTVSPAIAGLTGDALPGGAPTAPGGAAGPTAQPGPDPGVFAVLLTPLTVTAVPAPAAALPDGPAVPVNADPTALLTAFSGSGETERPALAAGDDSELLALLASFTAPPPPADLPAMPALPAVAGLPAAVPVDGAAPPAEDAVGILTAVSPHTATAAQATPLPAEAGPVQAFVQATPTGAAVPTTTAGTIVQSPVAATPAAPLPVQTKPTLPADAVPQHMLPPAAPQPAVVEAASPDAIAAPLSAAAPQLAEAVRKPSFPPQAPARIPTGTAMPRSASTAATEAPGDPVAPILPAIAEDPLPAAPAAPAAAMPAAVVEPAATTPLAVDGPASAPAAPAMPPAPPPAGDAGPAAETRPEAAKAVAELPVAAPTPTASHGSVADSSGQAAVSATRTEAPPAILRSETAQPAASRPDPNPLERAVAHQVSRAVIQHLPDGGARMVMRLTPPELGTVRIEFISRDGMVTARLMAEDEGVRQALDRALPHIRAEVRGDHPAIDITVDRSDQRHAWGEGHARQERQERRDEPRTGQGRRQREDDPVFTIDGAEPVVAAAPMRAAPQLGGRVGPTLVDALA